MGDDVNQSVKHGGNVHQVAKALGRPVSSFVDFSASINPLGPPASVLRAMRQALAGCVNYPDPQSEILRERLASEHGISQESILLGNGSAELIRVLPKALGLQHGYVVGPTFMEFEYSLKVAGAGCTYVHAESTRRYTPPLERLSQTLEENGLASRMMRRKNVASDLAVFFCHPNSPTGRVVPVQHLRQMMRQVDQAGCWMIVDEAFIEFSSSPSLIKDVTKHQRLLVLRSFTKFYAIPGIRLGYMIGPPDVIGTIHPHLPPWSVNHVAQAAGVAALADKYFRERSLRFIQQERRRFMSRLRAVPGLRVIPSQANFVMVELPEGCATERVVTRLEDQGILVRNCQTFSGVSPSALRLAIRRPQDNNRLVQALQGALQECRE